jgi:hypothetical protein
MLLRFALLPFAPLPTFFAGFCPFAAVMFLP